MAQGNSSADDNAAKKAEQSNATKVKQPAEASTSTKGNSGKSGARSSTMRYDIEGLRGLAIGLVVIFHVFVGKVSSGVDVFLLLGGIFFFGSQLRNAQNAKGLTFIQSLIRIIRRLFPLLAVVVASVLAASILLMNRLVHVQMAKDAVASLGYYINWQLAYSGREYTSVRTTVSPFQHLWSMSAQLQIYVASLVVVTLLALIFRKYARQALLVVLTAATVLSFAYATYFHFEDQTINYYSTLSRFWEIGLGGLLGMLLLRRDANGNPVLRPLGRWTRTVMGIVGLGMIISTGLFLDGADQFPGPWTLIPLVGALMVVLSGHSGEPVGVTRLLLTRPFQFLGRISYALYVWHWPILVLCVYYFNVPKVSPALGAAVIAASVVLAWLSNKLIERPLRQGKKPERNWVLLSPKYWAKSLSAWPKAVYAVLILVLAGSVVASPKYLQHREDVNSEQLWDLAADRSIYPGAASFLVNAPVPENMPIVPPLEDFHALLPQTQPDGCQIGFDSDALILTKNFNRSDEECAYGDVNSDKTIYVIGGSHSEHYIPALDIVGRNRHVKMIPLLKMGCPVNAKITRVNGEEYPSCLSWSEKVVDYIKENPPTEGIFMTGTRPSSISGAGPEQVPQEYRDLVQSFTDQGIHSWLMRDNPWQTTDKGAPRDMRACVAEMMEGKQGEVAENEDFPGLANPGRPNFDEVLAINAECGQSVWDSLLPVDPSIEAYKGMDVTLMDLTAGICREDWCPSIIGNMAVYRDAHHFNNIFAETLAPEIEAQMFNPNHKIPPMNVGLMPKHNQQAPPNPQN
ncbi:MULTISPECIES: acyltransferase family protein [unclassified Corynebacterium]|uniref:acyltransferase family protein n=1 Tax=unclassified Corynebacterium TaxID=2624378 RepID=UPI001EF3E63C|nr:MULTISPECIES: acyltransferase family protein [unclassified Corynebacterium]MCG7259188.1 acyltransferase [Corynebacterium sp. ACRQK]MCG7263486.1 acyltransferase [Corynebacterium sp. ACRQL]